MNLRAAAFSANISYQFRAGAVEWAFLRGEPAVVPALLDDSSPLPRKNVEMTLDTAGVDARATVTPEV
jgi:hypothetical protein